MKEDHHAAKKKNEKRHKRPDKGGKRGGPKAAAAAPDKVVGVDAKTQDVRVGALFCGLDAYRALLAPASERSSAVGDDKTHRILTRRDENLRKLVEGQAAPLSRFRKAIWGTEYPRVSTHLGPGLSQVPTGHVSHLVILHPVGDARNALSLALKAELDSLACDSTLTDRNTKRQIKGIGDALLRIGALEGTGPVVAQEIVGPSVATLPAPPSIEVLGEGPAEHPVSIASTKGWVLIDFCNVPPGLQYLCLVSLSETAPGFDDGTGSPHARVCYEQLAGRVTGLVKQYEHGHAGPFVPQDGPTHTFLAIEEQFYRKLLDFVGSTRTTLTNERLRAHRLVGANIVTALTGGLWQKKSVCYERFGKSISQCFSAHGLPVLRGHALDLSAEVDIRVRSANVCTWEKEKGWFYGTPVKHRIETTAPLKFYTFVAGHNVTGPSGREQRLGASLVPWRVPSVLDVPLANLLGEVGKVRRLGTLEDVRRALVSETFDSESLALHSRVLDERCKGQRTRPSPPTIAAFTSSRLGRGEGGVVVNSAEARGGISDGDVLEWLSSGSVSSEHVDPVGAFDEELKRSALDNESLDYLRTLVALGRLRTEDRADLLMLLPANDTPATIYSSRPTIGSITFTLRAWLRHFSDAILRLPGQNRSRRESLLLELEAVLVEEPWDTCDFDTLYYPVGLLSWCAIAWSFCVAEGVREAWVALNDILGFVVSGQRSPVNWSIIFEQTWAHALPLAPYSPKILNSVSRVDAPGLIRRAGWNEYYTAQTRVLNQYSTSAGSSEIVLPDTIVPLMMDAVKRAQKVWSGVEEFATSGGADNLAARVMAGFSRGLMGFVVDASPATGYAAGITARCASPMARWCRSSSFHIRNGWVGIGVSGRALTIGNTFGGTMGPVDALREFNALGDRLVVAKGTVLSTLVQRMFGSDQSAAEAEKRLLESVVSPQMQAMPRNFVEAWATRRLQIANRHNTTTQYTALLANWNSTSAEVKHDLVLKHLSSQPARLILKEDTAVVAGIRRSIVIQGDDEHLLDADQVFHDDPQRPYIMWAIGLAFAKHKTAAIINAGDAACVTEAINLLSMPITSFLTGSWGVVREENCIPGSRYLCTEILKTALKNFYAQFLPLGSSSQGFRV